MRTANIENRISVVVIKRRASDELQGFDGRLPSGGLRLRAAALERIRLDQLGANRSNSQDIALVREMQANPCRHAIISIS